jgi:hypothetical protein
MGNKKSNKGHSKNASSKKKNNQQMSGFKGGAFDVMSPTPKRSGKKKGK